MVCVPHLSHTHSCIPPPLAIPPPPRRGDCHFTVLLGYLLRWFVFPICRTHVLALLSHHFKSVTCVYSVIFSLQRQCTGCYVPFFRPKMFSPGNHVWYHSRTLGAHVLATVVGPSPNGPQFCHIRYIRPGGVTHVDHESAQLSRLEAVVVASPKSLPESPGTWGMCLMENCNRPSLSKHRLVQARRPRVAVVLRVFCDHGFYGQKSNAW